MNSNTDNKRQNNGRNEKGQFSKGNNAGGRTKGARNKSTLTALELMNGQIEQITQTLINKALEGDLHAIKLILERLIPICKENPLETVSMPKITKSEDLPQATQSILDLLSSGEILPSQASALTNALATHAKGLELFELSERIRKLEEAQE